MSLIDRLRADQLAARKAKNDIARSLLTTLLGETTTIAKNAGRDNPTDDEVTAVVRKFLKGNAEVQLHLKDEIDLAVARTEADLLNVYLPKQLTEQELRDAVIAAIAGGAANVGAIMGVLKTNFAGLYDGKLASSIIKEAFA